MLSWLINEIVTVEEEAEDNVVSRHPYSGRHGRGKQNGARTPCGAKRQFFPNALPVTEGLKLAIRIRDRDAPATLTKDLYRNCLTLRFTLSKKCKEFVKN